MNQLVVGGIEQYRRRIDKLETQLGDLSKEISEIATEIDGCIKKLEQEIPIWKKYRQLETEVDTLRAKQGKLRPEKKKEEMKIPKNLDKQCKKLYKIISKECHPDVCEDKHKNELFIDATEACKRGDLKTLLEISSILDGDSVKKEHYQPTEKFFKTKIFALEQDLVIKIRKLEKLMKSNSYIITKLYNSSDILAVSKAEKLFTDFFYDKMVKLSRKQEILNQNNG